MPYNLVGKFSVCPQKNILFGGRGLNCDCFEKNVEQRRSLEEQKADLRVKIREISTISENPEVLDDAENLLVYSKRPEQLALANFVFDEDFFHTPERMSKVKGIIGAVDSEYRNAFVKKVFSNKHCYKNEKLLGKVENILYTISENKYSYEGKFAFFDKVLTSEKLYKNKGFVDNVGQILYDYSNHFSCDKNLILLDGILNNEELSSNSDFIQAVGKVLAQKELKEESLSFSEKKVLSAVAVAKNYYAEDVFAQLINDEKFFGNEDLIVYLPNIVKEIWGENVNKAQDLADYLKEKEGRNPASFNVALIHEYLNTNYSKIEHAEPIARVKGKAYEKKSQLQGGNDVVTNVSVDAFFDENRKIIVPALEILGEKNFVHAYRLKMSGLKELCLGCNRIKEILNDDDCYEELLLKINPQASEQYKLLQAEISETKSKFVESQRGGDVSSSKELQNKINTLTLLSRQLVANKLDYDPDTVINKISVIANSVEGYEGVEKKRQLCRLVDLLNQSSIENDRRWQKAVCEQFFKKMNIPYDVKLADRLGLEQNKYVGKLLSANPDVVFDMKELCEEFLKNPDKSNLEIFNQYECNKVTKAKFEEYGLDYDKWVNFDENSYLVIKEASKKEDGDVIVRKVDMNNITKALFLGNEAGCCTAIGTGILHAKAVSYLKNKFVGAIEVLDNEKPVGNTMCYFAEVEGDLALVLDNIHVKSEYKNNATIRDGIFEYAKKLCEEVGKPNIPVYVSGHRNRVDLAEFDLNHYLIKIIGDSGVDKIYLDVETDYARVNPDITIWSELTRVA